MSAGPRAAIVAIGSEMLGPLRRDTNSVWLTERLEEIGKRFRDDQPLTHSRSAACTPRS